MSLTVVGTDTGIGKTVVTAGLTGWLLEEGHDARAIKPAQTGHPPDDDAGFVSDACEEPTAATCLRYLEPPLAPRVAAEETGVPLEYDDLLADVRTVLETVDCGIVEGIGGLRVPLAGDREVVDLVADIGLPTVVVARSGLGTLNHSALTVEALDRRDVPVQGVVLNEYEGGSTAERTNPSELARMVGRPVYTLPPLDLDPPSRAVTGVRAHLPPAVFPAGIRPP